MADLRLSQYEACDRQRGSTYVRRILEKKLGGRILEALQVLVDLALFFQEHGCGRLSCMSIAVGSRWLAEFKPLAALVLSEVARVPAAR